MTESPKRLARAVRDDLADNPERQLGEAAVARGWVTAEQFTELLKGDLSIVAEMVKRGWLTPARVAELIRQLHGDPMVDGVSADLPADVAAAMAEPGHVVSHYVKVSLLGHGAMGELWKAWDVRLGRWVAMKFLIAELGSAFDRFMREARLAGRLNHPGIVGVLDVGDAGGLPFIVMQFIDGAATPPAPMPPTRAVRIIRDVARAVHETHKHGILHRDLKPSNLLLDADDHVYVTDFGVAREVQPSASGTTPGAVVGTPSYMAPEQARGEHEKVTASSDIFSLGATLYELCTGRPPYVGEIFLDVVGQAIRGDTPAPRSIRRGIPEDVEAVILKAMDPQPSRRYLTAADMADDLQRWLDGAPVLARPLSMTGRWAKRVKSKPVVWLLAGATAALLLINLGIVMMRYAEARNLGGEGAQLAADGRLDEARQRLERSLALWEDEDIRATLDDVVLAARRRERELAVRASVNDLTTQYETVLNRIRPYVRQAEDLYFSGAMTEDARDRALIQIERELALVGAPLSTTNFQRAVRGWVLCHLGRTVEGEKELDEAAAGDDPFGLLYRVRWASQKLLLRTMTSRVTFPFSWSGPPLQLSLPAKRDDDLALLAALREAMQSIRSWPGWTEGSEPDSLARFLEGIAQLLESGYAEAEETLRPILGHPDLGAQAMVTTAFCRLLGAQYEGAAEAWHQLLQNRPAWVLMRRLRAMALMCEALSDPAADSKRREELLRRAIADCDHVQLHNRRLLEPYFFRAGSYRLLADLPEKRATDEHAELIGRAIADYDAVLTITPNDADTFAARASASRTVAAYLTTQGEFDGARDAYRQSADDMDRVLELRPDSPMVPGWRADRGMSYFGLALIEQDGYHHADHAREQFEKATEDLEFARDSDATLSVDAFVRLGEAHLMLTRLAEAAGEDPEPHPEEAVRAFDEAVDVAPQDWRAFNGRAISRLDVMRQAIKAGERDLAGHVAGVEADIEEALRTGPTRFEVYRLKAEFLHKNMRRPREAIPCYEKALELLGKPDERMEADLEAARLMALQMPEDF